MSVTQSDQSFIFRDEDFGCENADFDAAAFVCKFHRVIPLESLREQLVTYSNFIRKQLYVIINRDYKDFITIATKVSTSQWLGKFQHNILLFQNLETLISLFPLSSTYLYVVIAILFNIILIFLMLPAI
ncbi:hypothetical protein EON63_12975 [archaeon]|nr:MAG: hypothetical protein EON63_12975 [archaeon]